MLLFKDIYSNFLTLVQDRQLLEKLATLSNSTAELPIRSFTETKFSGRSRLYVGNLGNDIVEQDLKEYFSAYGEIAEVFLNKEKGFAFVRLVSVFYFIFFFKFLIAELEITGLSFEF